MATDEHASEAINNRFIVNVNLSLGYCQRDLLLGNLYQTSRRLN